MNGHILLLGALAALPIASAGVCNEGRSSGSMLVSGAWLEAHLHDAKLRILAVGPKSEFEAAHIPGSVFLDYLDIREDSSGLSLELPKSDRIASVFGKLGVNGDSHIVLYSMGSMDAPHARAFLTLDAIGLGQRAAILDGGFNLWRKQHRPVTSETAAPQASSLQPCLRTDVISTLDDVRANLHRKGVALVDARLAAYYSGDSFTNDRAGHVPGAVNLNFSSLIDGEGKLKTIPQLRHEFTAAGIKKNDQIITYCHIGQQASLIYFVAKYLGYRVRLYDGSWEEWARHPELPVDLPLLSVPKHP